MGCLVWDGSRNPGSIGASRKMNDGHDPRAVANAMIEFALKRNKPIWNVSIQKLMYFAHASFLIRNDRPLINGVFEAWEYGPVCRPIYDVLKRYGRKPVSKKIERVDPFSGEISVPQVEGDISALDQVEDVMRTMLHIHPSQLIELSHVDGGAWSVVWDKSRTGATVGNRISDQLTREKFGKLKVAMPINFELGGIDEATPFAGD